MEEPIDEIIPVEPGTVAGTLEAFRILIERTKIPEIRLDGIE